VEDRHQDRVYELYRQVAPEGLEPADLARQSSAQVMEGGEDVPRALARLFPQGFGARELLETAMGIEAQALDLYLRMSHQLGDEAARQTLFDLAQEEKTHLEALGQLLEQLGEE
jgi:rubrerythrin